MIIHEYQAREILSRYGIPVPRGAVAGTADEAVAAAREIGGDAWVLKAQVHAGGRGKGGGVKMCRSPADLERVSSEMIGMRLVTPQTGQEGRTVRRILVTEACRIRREFYVGVVLDRQLGMPLMMASSEGGVEIEEVAAKSPEKIFRQEFPPRGGLEPYQGRWLARDLGLPGEVLGSAADIFVRLSRAFLETDASLAEINPLVLTEDGKLIALDAKWVLDDNSLFRHPDLSGYRDYDEEDPQETRASKFDLSYVKLNGNVGCMVNGAGLAMATLDIIQHYGGEPANFLDVGGGATTDKVTEAFKIILEDPSVKAILVNIFGGIMKCDVIAAGILEAARNVALEVPLVVRLEGTNVEKGRQMLLESGVAVELADGLSEAAKKVVSLAGGAVS